VTTSSRNEPGRFCWTAHRSVFGAPPKKPRLVERGALPAHG